MDSRQQAMAVGESPPRPDTPGEGGTGPERAEELSLSAAIARRRRALTSQLMEQVVEPDNLNRAYARVLANKGSPGIDGMRVDQLADWVRGGTGRRSSRACSTGASSLNRCVG